MKKTYYTTLIRPVAQCPDKSYRRDIMMYLSEIMF